MKNLCIIQARMASTRLPGKILKEIAGVPLLEYLVKRLGQAKKIDKIIIATGEGESNDKMESLCQKINIDCFRGSENDVLDRYYQCSLKYPDYKNIVRITGDCPLIDPEVVDQVIDLFEQGSYDYASNVNPPTFPDGMDVEVFSRQALETSAKEATSKIDREHVNEYILRSNKFSKGNLKAPADYSRYRLTVDNKEDFEVIKFLINKSVSNAGYLDYIKLLEDNPEVLKINFHIKRNEGLRVPQEKENNQ